MFEIPRLNLLDSNEEIPSYLDNAKLSRWVDMEYGSKYKNPSSIKYGVDGKTRTQTAFFHNYNLFGYQPWRIFSSTTIDFNSVFDNAKTKTIPLSDSLGNESLGNESLGERKYYLNVGPGHTVSYYDNWELESINGLCDLNKFEGRFKDMEIEYPRHVDCEILATNPYKIISEHMKVWESPIRANNEPLNLSNLPADDAWEDVPLENALYREAGAEAVPENYNTVKPAGLPQASCLDRQYCDELSCSPDENHGAPVANWVDFKEGGYYIKFDLTVKMGHVKVYKVGDAKVYVVNF